MNYAFWADVTAFVHFLTLLAVFVGLLLCFRYKRFRPWEAAAIITIVLLWSYFGNCPLAILEQHLRDLAGQHVDVSSVSFTSYYVKKFFGVQLPSFAIQRFTFFSAGVLFSGSVKTFSPIMHMHLFSVRKGVRRFVFKKAVTPRVLTVKPAKRRR